MSQFSCKTHALHERYYKIYRIIFKILGLWPYQQSYLTRLHNLVFASILLTFIIAQADDLKQLLEQIKDDWNSLKDKLEISIIEEYAYDMRLFVVAITSKNINYYNIFCQVLSVIILVFTCFALFFCIIFESLPLILDVVLPLNESRQFHSVTITEYFVNEEKYIYYIVLHELLTGIIGTILLIGILLLIVMYMMHACALFKIASYRIENTIEKNVLMIPSPRKEDLLYRKIVYAVVMHQRAL
ncbi:uncharacterized protein LOC112552302, partial [Pogonomyrmex barbatus]|uniref:Uncharacterized protein LOC112552302 n=1 Tax=Pogonomyrmex barbatus TaxID=144034 RepID=A0A8N1S4P6_9HYME